MDVWIVLQYYWMGPIVFSGNSFPLEVNLCPGLAHQVDPQFSPTGHGSSPRQLSCITLFLFSVDSGTAQPPVGLLLDVLTVLEFLCPPPVEDKENKIFVFNIKSFLEVHRETKVLPLCTAYSHT